MMYDDSAYDCARVYVLSASQHAIPACTGWISRAEEKRKDMEVASAVYMVVAENKCGREKENARFYDGRGVATDEQQTPCGNEIFTLCSIMKSKVYPRQVFLGSKQFPSKIINTQLWHMWCACALCTEQTEGTSFVKIFVRTTITLYSLVKKEHKYSILWLLFSSSSTTTKGLALSLPIWFSILVRLQPFFSYLRQLVYRFFDKCQVL